jgi:hypothetical protein
MYHLIIHINKLYASLEMKTETIKYLYSDYQFEITIDEKGCCFCPVCGIKTGNKDWRPYNEDGTPTYDICECGFEYGFDDSGVPPYEESWDRYRKSWLNEELDFGDSKTKSLDKKIEQLKNIEIFI